MAEVPGLPVGHGGNGLEGLSAFGLRGFGVGLAYALMESQAEMGYPGIVPWPPLSKLRGLADEAPNSTEH